MNINLIALMISLIVFFVGYYTDFQLLINFKDNLIYWAIILLWKKFN